jgi:hypothetical protein
METLEDINLQPEAKHFSEKITVLSEQFFSILDDFTKYYVFYNKNPEVNEYQQFYLNSKSQLQKINKDVFLLTNDIEKDIEKLNYIVTRINSKLYAEKELNGELYGLISNLQNTTNSAFIMLDDAKYVYNKQYYLNVEIFLGICIVLGLSMNLLQKKI